ncbi:leucine-rich repeat-containing protein 71-like, partial [Melanaphis sacchari]|uniref:leucine-rich repeat-containing protein 71-like n=1 Tax=Melanaphis sacchari TaxID=742174 RepID=UPI000DC13207
FLRGKKIESKMEVYSNVHWYEQELSKTITKLSLTNYKVNQEILNSLSNYLKMEECLVMELVFDGIDLSNLNYLCCLTPDTKVKKLWLRFCQLKDKGVNHLLDILDETSGKTQLNSLYLDCNGITCEGAKKIAQILRTNRTLKSLSLARNLIKDEGAFALVSVLSKFQLNSDETNWKSMQELKSNRILEYLMDILTQKLKEKNSLSNDSIDCAGLTSIELTNLKQRAENMIVPHTHPYLTGQLLKSGLNYHSPGNFKIEYLNISYNRFSSNIINVIEQIFQYQQKVCLAKEGLRNIKIEGFDKKQIERMNKLIEGKLRLENNSKKFR